ncbi:hypothetical protein [Microcystis sp. M39BS1]|nr:hypothetical protein [Microcystis sp. M39BS1]
MRVTLIQLSVISYQLSVISYQLSVISGEVGKWGSGEVGRRENK